MSEETLRQQVSHVLNFAVRGGEDGWEKTFAMLESENRLNTKAIKQILLILLKREEAREKLEK